MKTCTGSFLKLIVFFFNFLFVLLSVAVITLATIAWNHTHDERDFVTDAGTVFIFVIVSASIVLAISFLACCGALLESYCMLTLFSYIVGAAVILQICAGVFVYRFKGEVQKEIIKAGDTFVSEYSANNISKNIIDEVQSKYQCCGITKLTDWDSYRKSATGHIDLPYPDSCCDKKDEGHCFKPYQQTCGDELYFALTKYSKWVMITLGGFIGVQIISMIAACCLASSTRSHYHQFV